jgi:hypothetical protein
MDGLLREQTLAHRLELLLAATIIDRARLVADPWRSTGRKGLARMLASLRERARFVFRDGRRIVPDAGSLNGRLVYGLWVGRSRLRPGDSLTVADRPLRVD